MHVLIPAGGKGTRLRPLTDEQPKPLLPLGDRPILSRILGGIPPEFPVTVIVTSALEERFRDWKRQYHPERHVDIFVEPPVREGEPAGPVSALAACVAALRVRTDALVMMGDSVHPFSWADFQASLQPGRAHIAAYQLPPDADARQFGVVEFSSEGWLLRLEEKPAHPRSRWVFTGCFFIPGRLVRTLPAVALQELPQVGQLVSAYLEAGEAVSVFPLKGKWNGIGTFLSYIDAHQSEMSDHQKRVLRAQGNHLEGVVYVHPSARISGSRLHNCVVSGNSVIRNADLSNCVVRSGTEIAGRVLCSKLVSSSGELSVG